MQKMNVLGSGPTLGSKPRCQMVVLGGSRAAICNPELFKTVYWMTRMWQHSCKALLPASHVILLQEYHAKNERLRLRPDPRI